MHLLDRGSWCTTEPGIASILVLQIALLVALVPLAYTTAPDPLWIPGIYDDADQDDVVGILTDEGLALAPAIGTAAQPVTTQARLLNRLAESLVTASAFSITRLRSPPSR